MPSTALCSVLIPKKWMMFSGDGMTIVNKSHVVTMSELDKFGIEFYNRALIAAHASSPIKKKVDMKRTLVTLVRLIHSDKHFKTSLTHLQTSLMRKTYNDFCSYTTSVTL